MGGGGGGGGGNFSYKMAVSDTDGNEAFGYKIDQILSFV